MTAPLFQAQLWVVAIGGGAVGFYDHGRVNPWPQVQFYQSKAAAVRQSNKLKAGLRFQDAGISVLPISVAVQGVTT